jgi:hypothetical protein
MPVVSIACFLIVHPLGDEHLLVGGSLECVMSGREFETDLFSALVSTIGTSLSVALPLAVLIIWVCS